MSRVSDSNRYPRRNINDRDTTYLNLEHNTRPHLKPIEPYTYYDLKTPTDHQFIRPVKDFKEIEAVKIYPDDELINPPIYKKIIDQQRVNIAGKYFNRTDLTGKVSSR